MRGKLLGALVCAALFTPQLAHAMLVGSPALQKGEMQFSFSGNLGYTLRGVENEDNDAELIDFDSRRLMLKPGFSIWPQLGFYGLIGFGDTQFRRGPNDFTGSLGFVGGGGIRSTFMDPSKAETNVNFDANIYGYDSEDGDLRASLVGYQASLYLSHTPKKNRADFYIGPKYSHESLAIHEPRAPTVRFQPQRNIGMVAGLQYHLTPTVPVSFEMQNFDESAIYFGIGFTAK